MAEAAMCARALALLAVLALSHSLTMDEDATSSLRKAAEVALDGGEVAILVRAPHGKSLRREELLHAKGADDVTVSLFYNRKSNKVSLESLHGGHLKAVSWTLVERPRSTMMLVMTSNRVRLVVGCKPLHWHSMSSRHDLPAMLASHKMKLYHEENAPIEVYNSEREALDSISCDRHDTIRPPALTTVGETDFEEVKDFIAKEGRRKREDEEMQGDDYRTNYVDPNAALPQPIPQRGDIPSSGIESCDDEIIRQLTLLRTTIEYLRREVGEQKGTIDGLRNQLRQCCNRIPSQPPVERCTGSSCYPGY